MAGSNERVCLVLIQDRRYTILAACGGLSIETKDVGLGGCASNLKDQLDVSKSFTVGLERITWVLIKLMINYNHVQHTSHK